MNTLSFSLRVIWACLKKDLKSARSEPLYTLVSIVLPLNVLLLMSLLVISGGPGSATHHPGLGCVGLCPHQSAHHRHHSRP
jgi:hypothetical protein